MTTTDSSRNRPSEPGPAGDPVDDRPGRDPGRAGARGGAGSILVAFLQIGMVVAGLGLLFVVSGWLTLRWSVHGEEVQVPRIVGLSLDEAERAVEERGLELDVEARRLADAEIPANSVLRQFPGGGTPLKSQRSVRVILSSGPADVEAPSMVGDYASKARISLQQQGQEVDYSAHVHTAEVEADKVVAQEPDPGELARGTTRPQRLLVSRGPRPPVYVMPDLIGSPRERVERFLRRHGFRLEEPVFRSSPTLPPGTVVGQRPSPGFRVEEGAVVRLQVSR